jgi:hypothetical protein
MKNDDKIRPIDRDNHWNFVSYYAHDGVIYWGIRILYMLEKLQSS